MLDKLDQTLRFQQTALSLRGYRQEILSANIANADTPYYKARDIDFSSALKTALGTSAPGASAPVQSTGLMRTSAQHLTGTQPQSAGLSQLLYRVPYQASADGNTVEMDNERSQFARNAIQYEAGIGFISAQIKNLLAVVQS